jgi:hypothetical protein
MGAIKRAVDFNAAQNRCIALQVRALGGKRQKMLAAQTPAGAAHVKPLSVQLRTLPVCLVEPDWLDPYGKGMSGARQFPFSTIQHRHPINGSRVCAPSDQKLDSGSCTNGIMVYHQTHRHFFTLKWSRS